MQAEIEIYKLRDRIAHLEAEVAFLYKHLGIEYVPEARPTDDPRIIEQLQKRNKLEAIKLYRQIYSTGQQEAVTAVDEMKGRLGL